MINPHNVGRLLSSYISELPPATQYKLGFGARDEDVAKNLFKNIETILACTEYSFENEESLDFHEETVHQSPEEDVEEDTLQDSDYDEDEGKDNIHQEFSLQYMRRAVAYHDQLNPVTGKKRHSWQSFHNKFKNVKNSGYITRFRKYISQQGTKTHKLNDIDSFTYESFEKARAQLLSVHDLDLRRWSLQKAREVGDTSFCASTYWIHHFKARHGICSRKITKLVTKKQVESKESIQESADNFVSKVQKLLPKFKPDNVVNTDQSGLQLEMYSNRTLSFEGEKLTVAKVRSMHNTTHSYTIQPLISLAGNAVGPLYLCLKEASGKMSDNIKETLFQADNIVLTCSKSGKLTTSLVEYWRDKVLIPAVANKECLLISDCWGAQGDEKIYGKMKHLERIEIPKHTTSMIQPLDVYWNRQYKHFIRKSHDYVRLYDIDINLAQRNEIIKLNSLAYNQICSPKFTSMTRYAWYQSGYLKNNPGPFFNVEQICFSFDSDRCHISKCTNTTFILCAYCSKVCCFSHFHTSYHYH